ncbi:hypothetical protein SLEP1_g47984 [Rubroshorea leprosula]|uniref:DUF4220 domain-containing protein n=1 Tax=Rubroshorea leprosula TaxID=152421 RepID=A0AAV5LS87_9ROSI|nr:hypothetical protein SLEP1_g47984 [Rubroshorea leprosula]
MQLKKIYSLAESLEELLDTCGIRGLIILSLSLQAFLILFSPLRRRTGGKWVWFVTIPTWMAYLLADWVAIFTIGVILRAESSDILPLWAPFLLLHLGGPDTITSFSLEDNELWIRHLLGLLLQVGLTVYIILLSVLSNDILWPPTLLVLIAGIIKYAERNRAFYLASFDHFGDNWERFIPFMPRIPVQFLNFLFFWMIKEIEEESFPEQIAGHLRRMIDKFQNMMCLGSRNQENHQKGSKEIETAKGTSIKALCLLGDIKSLLVGTPLSSFEKLLPAEDMHEMLRAIEIHLSLLYELLHTKLPVVDSKIGYACRIINLGCILGAFVSFSLLKKHLHHYKLLKFDIWLTYVLLIGALALDLISIILLTFSDWITMAHIPEVRNSLKFIDTCRWSNSVPQLNILACRFKNKDGDHPNKMIDLLGIRNLLETIRRSILCLSSKGFVENQVWSFIFTTIKEKNKAGSAYADFAWSLKKFQHMESLLMWHIATEICYRNSPSSTSTSNNSFNHREICKLLSDYMFYLLVMEPTMIDGSPKNLNEVFDGPLWKWPDIIRGEKGSIETIFKDLDKLLLEEEKDVNKLLEITKAVDKD